MYYYGPVGEANQAARTEVEPCDAEKSIHDQSH